LKIVSELASTVGVQENGWSPDCIKRMALGALGEAGGDNRIATAADIGGGRGDWARLLANHAERVFLLDYSRHKKPSCPSGSYRYKQI